MIRKEFIMKKKIVIMLCMAAASCMLFACGKNETPVSEVEGSTEQVSETSDTEDASGGGVSLDTAIPSDSEPVDETSDTEDTESDLPPDDAEPEDAAPVEKPETIRFVIVQNARDNMFTLTNEEEQTLIIDVDSETGYSGNMKPEAGGYETGASGYYQIPYSSSLKLSAMDDEIVYVSAEYPYTLAVAVQGADTVVLNDDRSVVITGKDNTTPFSYRVWMPSAGVKKEQANEVLVGKGGGSLKLYWDKSKIAVQQLTGSPVELAEDSELSTVDWRTACPWADKIVTGLWSDGADLSNIDQLKKGIMSAEFTPVTEIEEEGAKVSELTFYDAEKKKLGELKFWQKGNHVEIDGKKFDYDTFGLEE